VIHGHITPFQDLDGDGADDADLDTYTVTVTAPTLLRVTADGINGLAAGFLAVDAATASTPASLSTWQRYGIDLTGDTSARQLLLPAAGTYLLGIADTRSLFLGGGAAGGSAAQYYVTVEQLAIPTPTPVAFAGSNRASTTTTLPTGEVAFYAIPFGTGLDSLELSCDAAAAQLSVVALNNNVFRNAAQISRDAGQAVAATLPIGGIAPGDSTVVVVDDVYDYAPAPVTYQLDAVTSDAQQLPAAGGTVAGVALTGNRNGFSPFEIVPWATSWYVDIDAATTLMQVRWSWSAPVDAALFDQDGNVVAPFSFDPRAGQFFADSWTDYAGLIAFPRPGRYYLTGYPVGATPGDSFAVTSQLQAVTPVAAANDETVSAITVTAGGSAGDAAFSYSVGTTELFRELTATTSAGSDGELHVYAAATAFGALDDYAIDGTVRGPDPQPLSGATFVASTELDTFLGASATPLLVTVATADPRVSLTSSADPRATDEGDLAPGATKTATATAPAGGASLIYYLTVTPGSTVTLTTHPTTGTFDTTVIAFGADGSSLANGSGSASRDTTTTLVVGAGQHWLVVELDLDDAGTATIMFAASSVTSYAVSTGTTVYADACADGSNIPVSDTDDGMSTIPIAAPSGFHYYGQPVTSVYVSTNGFLSFDASAYSDSDEQPMPSQNDPFSLVAPYWSDLFDVTVCTATRGSTLVVQWSGIDYEHHTRHIQTQAILDPADSSIELVYASTMTTTGLYATVGIQDFTAAIATQIEFNTVGAITPGTAKKLTPH
jgi:hypothetical protein